MRIFLVLFCSFALACIAGAQGTKKKSKSASKPMRPAPAHHAESRQVSPGIKPTINQANIPQHHAQPNAPPRQPPEVTQPPLAQQLGGYRPTAVPAPPLALNQPGSPRQPGKPATPLNEPAQSRRPSKPSQPALTQQQLNEANARDEGFRSAEQYREWKKTGKFQGLENFAATGRIPQHFNLPTKMEPGVSGVTFQQNGRIKDCQNWPGEKYAVFRNYRACWHDKAWWTRNHARIVFVFGGWYCLNAHYWFPAWGYDSVGSYAYDGPIYAYSDLPPDQSVANVQVMLQGLGYYRGAVNGQLDSLTRAAIAAYQRDHGLYMTSAIDELTLASLGMT